MDEIRREDNPLLDGEAYRQQIFDRQKEKRKKNFYFVFGLIAVIFSLIGFFGCILLSVNFFRDKNAQKEEAEFKEYNEFLVAVAAVDPDNFDDITAASMEELIEISVWSIISSDLEPDKYDYSSGELAIPLMDVETAFREYFGTQLTIGHQSVTGYGYEFSYSEEDSCYYIPLTTIEPLYTPSVTDSEVKGDTVTLTVGFINANSWKQDSATGDISRPDPDKFVKITLRTSGQDSFISAIRSTSLPETAIVEVFTTEKTTEETSAAEETTLTEETTLSE